MCHEETRNWDAFYKSKTSKCCQALTSKYKNLIRDWNVLVSKYSTLDILEKGQIWVPLTSIVFFIYAMQVNRNLRVWNDKFLITETDFFVRPYQNTSIQPMWTKLHNNEGVKTAIMCTYASMSDIMWIRAHTHVKILPSCPSNLHLTPIMAQKFKFWLYLMHVDLQQTSSSCIFQ